MSKLLWMALQAAIVGGLIYIEVDIASIEHREPKLGIALFLGTVLAFVATIIPIAVIEGVKDVRRIYLPAIRRWSARRKVPAARSLTDPR
jgi:hypothetical protein